MRRHIGIRHQHGKAAEGGIREKLKVVNGVQCLVAGLAGHVVVAIIMIDIAAVPQMDMLMCARIRVELANMLHLMCKANATARPCAAIHHGHDEHKKGEVVGE
ncbi:hypothetical protein [Janthinobacterium sp. HLX7-2]|uniref:hypothetical protein n=1 Tax=Janthinobacterium sp. HLX7-2 TaxID=1259331 RepID=UPI003F26B7E6